MYRKKNNIVLRFLKNDAPDIPNVALFLIGSVTRETSRMKNISQAAKGSRYESIPRKPASEIHWRPWGRRRPYINR